MKYAVAAAHGPRKCALEIIKGLGCRILMAQPSRPIWSGINKACPRLPAIT